MRLPAAAPTARGRRRRAGSVAAEPERRCRRQRGRRRPRRHPAGRPRAADRRERPRASRGSCSTPARAQGFKGLVATTGAAALALAREYHPAAVTLDIHLPDMQGWRILDRLKSSTDDAAHPGLRGLHRRCARAGAAGGRGRLPGQAAAIGRRSSTRRWRDLRALRRAHAAPAARRAGRRASCAAASSPASAASIEVRRRRRRRRGPRGAGRMPTRMRARSAARRCSSRRTWSRRSSARGGCQLPVVSTAPRRAADASRGARRTGGVARCARRTRSTRCSSTRRSACTATAACCRTPSARRWTRCTACSRTLAGQQGADRRRRHAQHLRAVDRARRRGHGHRLGRQRPRRDPPWWQTTRRSTSC